MMIICEFGPGLCKFGWEFVFFLLIPYPFSDSCRRGFCMLFGYIFGFVCLFFFFFLFPL